MSTSNLLIRLKDLTENPTARVAVGMVLDTSASMDCVEGEARLTGQTIFRDGKNWNVVEDGVTRLDMMTKGIRKFYDAIRQDEVAEASAEIGIVTFDDTARCVLDFANIYRQEEMPSFKTGDKTCLGEGVNLALDLLEQRKREYVDSGVDYYQPWIVIMTDGEPNGDPQELERAIARVSAAVRDRKLTVFPIAVGKNADQSVLRRFSPDQTVLDLDGADFQKFFAWLSRSVVRASQSMGEPVELDLGEVKNWDTLGD